ncbi:hypothetical protein ACFO25_16495 [Paenactinomyces guangxiensis]|uniref:Uncharacterized protein n=1 Tax=Paenactinomyces guangxiensis TaxID=1490290 RepID=A0A7W2A9U1_9BACL|nr:hypothetical protein [Paenactinomyces guangxiensis]MBA4496085.1 hypothetical protein [Paenactinomyces guangxiensis]MBH8593173.1 hypothetical protein [Paenactinomyces guangxiensis]
MFSIKCGKKTWLFTGAILFLAAVSNFILFQFIKEPDQQSVHINMVTDLNDPRKLAGLAENIFVGKVISQAGTKSLSQLPETQFNVEVIQNIKGNLSGTVLVNQQGGYNQDQELVLVENDPLLKPGHTYLFSTRYLQQEDWHTVIPIHGDVPLKSTSELQAKILNIKKAVQQQIQFQPEK